MLRIPRLISALTILGLLSYLPAFAQFSAPSQTMLVLPFENQSKAPGLEWISESFPEVIGQRMASSNFLMVAREDRAYAFDRFGIPAGAKLSRVTLYRIAEQMDADLVVMGTYNYDGQVFSASAQLLDMKALQMSDPMSESGPLVNMVQVEQALAWDLLHQVKSPGLPGRADFLNNSPNIRLDAFENYVRGVMATTRQEKIQRFREALRLNATYTQAMMELGRTYFDQHEYESAASWYARIPKTDPLASEANFYGGLSAFYMNDMAHAEESFRFLESHLPLTEVYNNLGVVLGRRGKRAELDYFEKAVQADPNDPDYHFNLAIAQYRAGDAANAVKQLRETLTLKPTDTEAKTLLDQMGANGGSSYRPVQNAALKLPLQRIKRNYDETSYRQLALEIERAAEARYAKAPPAEHAKFHVERGQEFLKQGFNDEAEKSFREAIMLDPTNAQAHTGLASVMEATGNETGAMNEARASVQLQPTVDAYLLVARLNLKQNKLDAAGEEIDRALALEPGNASATELKHTLEEKLAARKPQ